MWLWLGLGWVRFRVMAIARREVAAALMREDAVLTLARAPYS